MTSRRRRLGGSLLGLAALLLATGAQADWPMARHDARRSGAAAGKSDIVTPEVAWKAYLGGTLAPTQLLAADAEADGHEDLIRASGGTVAAVRADGSTLWSTRVAGALSLLGVVDLDGDGRDEVVAYSSLGATALDLATGAVVWAQPAGEMGEVSVVRLADLTGDGKPDLVIGECRGCGGDKPQSGFLYSFPSGFAAPSRLALPYPAVDVQSESTVVSRLGKGPAALLTVNAGSTLQLVDGVTGLVVAGIDVGFDIGQSFVAGCVAADLDGVAGDEALCLVASRGGAFAPQKTKLVALGFGTGATPAPAVLWSFSPAGEQLSSTSHDLLVDLDADGALETVVTGTDAAGSPTVHVLRARTGAEITSLAGASLAGTAKGLPGGGSILLTAPAATSTAGVSLHRFGGGQLQPLGALDPAAQVLFTVDRERFAVSSAQYFRPIFFDVTGGGASQLVTIEKPSGTLQALSIGASGPTVAASVVLPASASLAGAWPLPAVTGAFPQLGLLTADGNLTLRDRALSAASGPIHVGGYYAAGGYFQLGASPVVAALSGGPAEQVLMVDSRGVLLGLDASQASASAPPGVLWESADCAAPAVAKGAAGPAIFVRHLVDRATSSFSLRRLDATGAVVWEVPITASPYNDLVTGDFDGDGVPDVALQSGVPAQAALGTYAFSGKDGQVSWRTTGTICGEPAGLSVADWDGDGVDDVVQQLGGTQVSSGKGGAPLASGGPGDCYYLPMLHRDEAGDVDEVVFTGGYSSERAYDRDLSTMLFANQEDDRPYPYGALAECPAGAVLVQGSWAHPNRLRLTTVSGPGAGQATSVFLSGGALYTDEVAAEAHGLAQLSAASVHPNLDGSGQPAALVGSGDGFLYAIDPCAGDLLFTHDFGAPVGEPVFGDTDGDGNDEIVVSVYDGYLYALKNQAPVTGAGGSGGAGASTGVGSATSGAGGSGGEDAASSSGTSGGATGSTGAGGSHRGGTAGCHCEVGAASGSSPFGLLAIGGLGLALAGARRRGGRSRRP